MTSWSVGVRRRPGDHQRAGSRPRRDQVVLAQPAQRLPHGVAADRKPFAQFVFGGQLRADRDRRPRRSPYAACAPPECSGDRREWFRVMSTRPVSAGCSASTLPSRVGRDVQRCRRVRPRCPRTAPAVRRTAACPCSGLGSTPGGAPTGRPEAMVLRTLLFRSNCDDCLGVRRRRCRAGRPRTRMPCGLCNPSTTVSAPDPVSLRSRARHPIRRPAGCRRVRWPRRLGRRRPEASTSTLPERQTDSTRPVPSSATTTASPGPIATP